MYLSFSTCITEYKSDTCLSPNDKLPSIISISLLDTIIGTTTVDSISLFTGMIISTTPSNCFKVSTLSKSTVQSISFIL